MKNVLFFSLIVAGLFVTTNVFATISSNAFGLPCIGTNCPSVTNDNVAIQGYLVRLYSFGLGISGILAVGMIIVGAIYRSISGGSPDKISEGNDMIKSAIWGLLLLFGSYLILQTINPVLVDLRTPDAPDATLKTLQLSGGIGVSASSSCPIASEAACFFDPDEDPPENCNYLTEYDNDCTAIDATTAECGGATPLHACECPNCRVITKSTGIVALLGNLYPIKPGACGGGAGNLGQCFLNKNSVHALRNFLSSMLGTGSNSGYIQAHLVLDPINGWRITEAFPPTSEHLDQCHYRGTCFDFATQQYGGNFSAAQTCNDILWVATKAIPNFRSIIIEGLPINTCPNIVSGRIPGLLRRATTTYSTGFHFHINAN